MDPTQAVCQLLSRAVGSDGRRSALRTATTTLSSIVTAATAAAAADGADAASSAAATTAAVSNLRQLIVAAIQTLTTEMQQQQPPASDSSSTAAAAASGLDGVATALLDALTNHVGNVTRRPVTWETRAFMVKAITANVAPLPLSGSVFEKTYRLLDTIAASTVLPRKSVAADEADYVRAEPEIRVALAGAIALCGSNAVNGAHAQRLLLASSAANLTRDEAQRHAAAVKAAPDFAAALRSQQAQEGLAAVFRETDPARVEERMAAVRQNIRENHRASIERKDTVLAFHEAADAIDRAVSSSSGDDSVTAAIVVQRLRCVSAALRTLIELRLPPVNEGDAIMLATERLYKHAHDAWFAATKAEEGHERSTVAADADDAAVVSSPTELESALEHFVECVGAFLTTAAPRYVNPLTDPVAAASADADESAATVAAASPAAPLGREGLVKIARVILDAQCRWVTPYLPTGDAAAESSTLCAPVAAADDADNAAESEKTPEPEVDTTATAAEVATDEAVDQKTVDASRMQRMYLALDLASACRVVCNPLYKGLLGDLPADAPSLKSLYALSDQVEKAHDTLRAYLVAVGFAQDEVTDVRGKRGRERRESRRGRDRREGESGRPAEVDPEYADDAKIAAARESQLRAFNRSLRYVIAMLEHRDRRLLPSALRRH